MFDGDQQIDAVRRQVGARTIEAGEARTVTVAQTYDAPIEDVWDACTNPERIPRWFMPISGDLRVGGRYQLEGNAGGKIERCEPPASFSATWEYGGEVSWIEVRLTAESPERTRFELEHLWVGDEEKWSEFGPGAVGIGWDLGLLGLAGHLSGAPGAVSPEESGAWLASEEGMRFMKRSGEAWYEAHVASGADPEQARARADRTLAAYTAPPTED
ncbi:uncharacterized protein YndB with AHSA1/START domain [Thermocatellispora tengchongensis]|uniref:Uncharacterized protein YndB with AHSA1/START domain n=1 Tax=Thermocatellispora tengchongensis TaxID=1073253 RepID=A0A840NYX2_9ACTN|nr:SRPBCC family protein [Thermocatellispora tengchongensis]MBB5130330.1 uncharacterized protein YndB with AHSA1/START domain [Thermocatellispora tengchongensis]